MAIKSKNKRNATQPPKQRGAKRASTSNATSPEVEQTESFKNSASLETVRSGYLLKVDELECALREVTYPEEFRNLKDLEDRLVYQTLKKLFDIVFSIIVLLRSGGSALYWR